jgi:hypothetical protein
MGSLRPRGLPFISKEFLAESGEGILRGLFQAWNGFFPRHAGMSAPLCCSICFLTLPGRACSARRSSYVFCRFIQNSTVISKNVAGRTAVSPVMPRCPLTIAVIRFAGTSAVFLLGRVQRSTLSVSCTRLRVQPAEMMGYKVHQAARKLSRAIHTEGIWLLWFGSLLQCRTSYATSMHRGAAVL